MNVGNSNAKIILRALEGARERGLTRKEISKAVGGKICDCENWIETLLEAGIIEKCGKRSNADLYRLVNRQK